MDGPRTPSRFSFQSATGAYCAGASAAYISHPVRNASPPQPLSLRSWLPLSIDAHAKHAPGQHPFTKLFWWEKPGSFILRPVANDGNAGPLDTHQGPRLVLRSIRVLMLDTLWSSIVHYAYGKAWPFHAPDLSLQSGGATLLHTAGVAAVALDVLSDSRLIYSSSRMIMPDTIWDRIPLSH
jgi:hypothetical protein